MKFGLESLCGLFLLGNQEVDCRLGWGLSGAGAIPSLLAGIRLRTEPPCMPPRASRDAPEASQGSQPVLGWHASAKGDRGNPALFWGMSGSPCTPAGAILSSAYVLPKSTGHRASIVLFGYPLPPGGGGCLALARTSTPTQGIPIKSLPRLRPKGSRSSHYLVTSSQSPQALRCT